MSKAIQGLRPEGVWKYFAEISKIPRCSKNEGAIIRYVCSTAKSLGLEARTDKAGNVVVRMPASRGREQARSVCLQGHLDMVGEKNKDKVHDFSKDPIELVRKGNVLMANGTTLGADNGIAVATCLAIMADPSIEHPPLEFLFTVDEETGLTGANALEPGFVSSRTLVNLDSEEEGALFVGCSGGRDTRASWKAAYEPAPAGSAAVEVRVRGLKGGHSGLEIDKGRGNAIKLLTRSLLRLAEQGARLGSINGGNKHNAIPREADAVLFISKAKVEACLELVERLNGTLRAELAGVEPDLTLSAEVLPRLRRGTVLRRTLQKKILQALTAVPHGVIKMSAEITGLVETSTNLAVIQTAKKEIGIITSQRSSVASEIDEIAEMVRTVLLMAGAAAESFHGYPGWKPNLSSEILRVARTTHAVVFGREPEVKAIHAGLECGIIGEKYPGMDMVSLGPTLEGVHSPDEKIHIDTVERFWDYLLAILKNVP